MTIKNINPYGLNNHQAKLLRRLKRFDKEQLKIIFKSVFGETALQEAADNNLKRSDYICLIEERLLRALSSHKRL